MPGPSIDAKSGIAQFSSILSGGEGPKTVGGTAEERNEWNLDPNSSFIAALQNTAGATKDMAIQMTFYAVKD